MHNVVPAINIDWWMFLHDLMCFYGVKCDVNSNT